MNATRCGYLLWLTALAGCVQIIPVAPTPTHQVRPPPPPEPAPAPGPHEASATVTVHVPEPAPTPASDRRPPPDYVASPAPRDYVVGRADVATLALGENHTCTLSRAGQIRCWGYNKKGALGVGTSKHPADGTVSGIAGRVRALVAGGYQTCALTSDGTVWCWGMNHVGQVGNGRVSDAAVTRPHRVRGISGVRSIHAGDTVTCAITGGGQVFCWGDNASGQITSSGTKHITAPTVLAGVGNASSVAIGNHHLCVLSDGRVHCRGNRSASHPDGERLTNVSAIAAGYQHTCAISGGNVYCWGSNYNGVLGLGDPCGNRPPSKQVEDGVRICDANLSTANRAPTRVSGISGNAVQISGLDYHSCALLQSGDVVCWGSNQGFRFSGRRRARTGRMPITLTGVGRADAVHVGGVHTCWISADVATCRGNNWAGAVHGPK